MIANQVVGQRERDDAGDQRHRQHGQRRTTVPDTELPRYLTEYERRDHDDPDRNQGGLDGLPAFGEAGFDRHEEIQRHPE
ncbi:MAG TPA: hypothetical protein VF462_17120 [Micromonosporaceae bacterium]